MTGRRALAIAAIAAAAAALAGCSLLGGPEPTPTPTDPSAGVSIDVFDIAVGDCLLEAGDRGDVNIVRKVDCDQPHAREAYASITMDDGDFPGEDATKTTAFAQCTTAFNSFVGVDYGLSALNFAAIYPTQASWENDDREILCLIIDPAGDVTGSLRGAAR